MAQRILLYALLLSFTAHAQPLWLKEVAAAAKGKSFDSKAAFAVLHYSAEVRISEKLKSTTHVRLACKVLLKKGESDVLLTEPGSKNLTINNLQGWSLMPDGRILELKKTDIVKLSPFEEVAYYGDSYILGAVPPNREPGTIVAYEYDQEESGLGALFQQCTLQTQQPVLFARLTVTAPNGWQLNYAGDNLQPVKIEGGMATLTATATGLPYQPEEPYMPPWSYLARRIFVVAANQDPADKNTIRSWQGVADWYRAILAQFEQNDPEMIKSAREVVAGCITPADKIEAISRFVQEKIRYVAVEFGKGAYSPRPASETLTKMYGDCKDKAVLMCTMLKIAGVEALPALTNSSYRIRQELPNPFQFDHVIVAVPLTALAGAFASDRALVGNWLFIDPTDPTTQVGDLPSSLQGSYALPADVASTELIRLPYSLAEHNAREYAADATLHPDGSVTALVTVKYLGNIAREQHYTNQFLTAEEQTEKWRNYLDSTIPNVQISEVSTSDKGDTTRMRFNLKGSGYLPHNGDQWLLKADFFLDPGQYRLTAAQRFHPIWFGPARKYQSRITWHLPPGWHIDPATHQINLEDSNLRLGCSAVWQDSLLRYEYSYERSGRLLAPEEYPRAQSIHRTDVQCDGLMLLVKPATPSDKVGK